jgi:hypothetical protein
MKLTIQVNANIYEVYYNLLDENKHAPVERVFRECFSQAINELEGNIEAVKQVMKTKKLNLDIYDIRVNE